MKFNDKELAAVAGLPADKEGRLNHKGNSQRDGYRERWFKLKGNLLFYYRLNEHGAVPNQEKPDGVYVIEQCKVQMEPKADSPFVFSVVFAGDQDKKHFFCGQSERSCEKWVKTLRCASYESLRHRLLQLKILIEKTTGQDPLQKYGVQIQFQNSLKPPTQGSIPRNKSAPSTVWLLDLHS